MSEVKVITMEDADQMGFTDYFYDISNYVSDTLEINIGDQVSSKSRKDKGTVINKTRRSITIKWGKSTQKIIFDTVPWDWSDYDYKKV